MPKCVKCHEFLHPDFCVIVDHTNNACKCVWCYTEKKEIMVEHDDGTPDYPVKKKEAIQNYKIYIQDLKDSEKIQGAMMKKQQNPFKM